MELRDTTTGRFVRLEPVAYQFPHLVGVEFDSDWLIIRGSARSDDEEWSFQEPSLLVAEAEDLGVWMRSAARGEAPMLVPDDDGLTSPTAHHVEPNLGMGVVSYPDGAVIVRIFLWLESAPPSTWEEVGRGKFDMTFFLDLTLTPEALEIAAHEWEAELERFPQRV